MDGYPDDWFRDSAGQGRGAHGGGNRGYGSTEQRRPGDPTVQLPHGQAGGLPGGTQRGGTQPGGAQPGGAPWPDQPPLRGSYGPGSYGPGPGGPDGPGPRGPGRRTAHRGRRILKIVSAVVVLLLIATVGMYFYLDSKLQRAPVLADYPGRPAATAGQNWLITGSDARQGLTRAQEAQLHTGAATPGERSDTVMLLHIGGGTPTLISLPRDLYVDIPGHGMNKLNAAFSFGGPALLAQTVQNYTGLRIDHYMGIGFGGLVNVVNAVGGVNICVKHTLDDAASGLHLKPGCQTLNGAQALGYVRDRHSFGASDLQRVQDQRAFLKALLSKATSPTVFLNPFAAVPTATSSAGSLIVGQGTHLYQLIQVAFALRGPQTTTVPTAGGETTAVGDVLVTDHAKATELFNDLGSDRTVPKDLLSGTSGA
jgi:LCP family protein required for cell wall assembly